MRLGRRRLIGFLGGAVAAGAFFPARAEPFDIGVLSPVPKGGMRERYRAFFAELSDLGYVDGANIRLELRSSDGAYDRLRPLADELVRRNVDLIVAFGTPASQAAKAATTSIPIVGVGLGDPVASGLVKSLARPGGNFTGTSNISPPLIVKRLELLKEAAPRIRRVALLMNPGNPAQRLSLEAMQRAASQMEVEARGLEVRNLGEIQERVPASAKDRVDAIVVANDSLLNGNVAIIARAALAHRLLSAGSKEYALSGGLLGYGSIDEVYRHSALYVDRILKGAKPADLPVQQPSRFEVVLNARTARAMKLDLAPAFLPRVDRVIE